MKDEFSPHAFYRLRDRKTGEYFAGLNCKTEGAPMTWTAHEAKGTPIIIGSSIEPLFRRMGREWASRWEVVKA